jgi:uncharacterized protein
MTTASLNGIFSGIAPLIGMVHLLPLPGSPGFSGSLEAVVDRALADARALQEAGFDAIIVENFGDTPYPVGPGPIERTVAMTTILREVRRAVSLPIGINVQFNDYAAELALARYGGASFIRVEAFVDSVMTPGGPAFACAPALTRLGAAMAGPPVLIVADVHVKESVPIAAAPLATSARNAEQAGAAALIVTGSATGAATPLEAVAEAKRATSLPVFVGSGMSARTAAATLAVADGAIVGTATKQDSRATNPVDPSLARAVVAAARALPQPVDDLARPPA